MKTSTKAALAVVGALVIAGFIYGAYQYPVSEQSATASPAGSTFISSKIASQSIGVATDTVFAILNTDSNDRTIQGAQVFLVGGAATTTLYTIKCATSSTAGGINGNTNLVFNDGLSIYDGTTTPLGNSFYVSSTSPGIMGTSSVGLIVGISKTGSVARIWPSGSYLVCKNSTSNGSNSNLFDSAMTGTISFPYTAQ